MTMNYADFLIIFLSKTVDELKIPSISNYMLDDLLKNALKYFENHPSIANIKRKGFDARITSEVIKFKSCI